MGLFLIFIGILFLFAGGWVNPLFGIFLIVCGISYFIEKLKKK